MCVSDLGKGRIIYTCLILTFLLRHPNLVVGRDKKLGYRDSMYSHLYVFVLRYAKKQRCYSCSDWPSFYLIFGTLWETTARPAYIPINWCYSSVKCYFEAEIQCLIVTVLKYFAFTQAILICRILMRMSTSVFKVPFQISHPQINR